MQLLLTHGADINCSDAFLDPPIFAAIRGRRVPVLQYFLANGADIEQRDREDWTPLMLVAKIGDANLADCLLAAGKSLPYFEMPTSFAIARTFFFFTLKDN